MFVVWASSNQYSDLKILATAALISLWCNIYQFYRLFLNFECITVCRSLFNFDEIKQFANCMRNSNGFNFVKNKQIWLKQKDLVDIFSNFNFFYSFWIHFWEKHDLWRVFELFCFRLIWCRWQPIFMKMMYSNVI